MFPVLLFLLFLFSGCGRDPIVFPSGPPEIAFDLVIPSNTPAGAYHGVSGVAIRTEFVPIGHDTSQQYVESSVTAFYAQFAPEPGQAAPLQVMINTDTLDRHRGTDTFRLEQASSLRTLVGENRWKLYGSGGESDTTFFIAPTLTALDSVSPLYRSDIRGDTALPLRWKAGGGAGIQLIWTLQGSSYVYSKVISDNGSFVIPAEEVRKLRGVGTVTLTRYVSSNHTYNGQTLVLTRLAQRTYDVTLP